MEVAGEAEMVYNFQMLSNNACVVFLTCTGLTGAADQAPLASRSGEAGGDHGFDSSHARWPSATGH